LKEEEAIQRSLRLVEEVRNRIGHQSLLLVLVLVVVVVELEEVLEQSRPECERAHTRVVGNFNFFLSFFSDKRVFGSEIHYNLYWILI